MKAGRDDLADLIRHSEYTGGQTSPVGDQFQYRLDNGDLLIVYTSESLPDADTEDEDVIDTAESFAVVGEDEAIPNRWDRTVLFEVE